MKTFWLMAVMIAVASCGAPAPVQREYISTAGGPSLPRGVVWTDGHQPVLVSSAGAAQCRATSPAEAQVALQRTNAVRAQAGLAPLHTNPLLQRAAEQQACDMASRGTMTHAGTATTGPAARVKALGYRPQLTAENIAAGATRLFDLNGTVGQWIASPGHRANILIPQMQDYGIGSALSADGRTIFWSSVYADPR